MPSSYPATRDGALWSMAAVMRPSCTRAAGPGAHNDVVEQRIEATRLGDGTEIAYALAGRGPFLVYVPGWLTHLELSWALPAERRFYEALAQGRTLLRYDKPGTGLSGPFDKPYSMEVERETLEAVVRAAGATRF